MALTDIQEAAILQYVFGRVSFTPPPLWFAGLSSTEITEAGTGATEPGIGNYARVAIPNSTVGFTYSGNQITNGTQIQFPTATISWGQLNYLFFSDLASGGSIYARGSLSPSQTIGVNQRLFLDPGDLLLTLD
mgnify:CR=1 FL=1